MTDDRHAGGGPPPKVVVTSLGSLRMLTEPLRPASLRVGAERLTAPFEIRWETSGEPARIAEAVKDADMLVTENEVPVTRDILEAGRKLRHVQINGARCLALDREAARSLGLSVATLPAVTSETVAEHSLALILALARRLPNGDAIVRRGSAAHEPVTVVPGRASYNWPQLGGLKSISGTTLCILGLGDIGYALAGRAVALGMQVCYWQRNRLPEAEEAAMGVRFVGFEEALQIADWLSIHVRFTPETLGMIGERELALMKPGAFLINTARGPIVEEAPLIEALREGRLAGAGLDVFWVEPPSPDHPLLGMENVVLTPHCAAGDFDTALREVEAVFDQLRAVWRGDAPDHPVHL